MRLKDIIHLKETEPDRFWFSFFKQALEDIRNPRFKDYLDYSYYESLRDFLGKKKASVPYPYHRLHIPLEIDIDELNYVIQWFAMSDYQLYHVLTGLIALPLSSFYTFHLHADFEFSGECEMDVFTPHFFARYAEKSYRVDTDIPLPNTLHFTKYRDDSMAPSIKDFQKFAKFIGKFFGRNKTNRLCENLSSVIADNEKDKNQLVCLWCDGLSYCVPYANGKVILHKTFVPYSELKESQLRDILPELLMQIKMCCEMFPSQYGSKEAFLKTIMGYMKGDSTE